MYFAEIFRRFGEFFPNTRILVEHTFDVSRFSDIPLDASLAFVRIPLKRSINGVAYDSEIKLPTLRNVISFLSRKADLVITVEFTPIALLAFVCFRLFRRKPLLLLIENSPSFRQERSLSAMVLLKRFVARRATLVMTNNVSGETFIRDILKVENKRIFVAPYLTSEPSRAAGTKNVTPEKPPALRRNPNTLNLLFLNSVTKRKGLGELIDAWVQLPSDSQKKITLHVVGDGPELEAIAARVAAVGLSNNMICYGRIDFAETRDFYQAADVFVSPTLADYRSLTGFEALACGKPLIMSRFDGAAMELIDDGQNGFLIDPRDSHKFAAAIRWFIENAHELPRMSAASRRLAEAFTYEKIAENLATASSFCLKEGEDAKKAC
jgi:glycosyltransferase involved in cell wall biosynthesis